MAAARKKAAARSEAVDVDRVLAGYGRWLARQPLAARTRDAYRAQVAGFVTWLASSEPARSERAFGARSRSRRHRICK